jgi:hypothetical protein
LAWQLGQGSLCMQLNTTRCSAWLSLPKSS